MYILFLAEAPPEDMPPLEGEDDDASRMEEVDWESELIKLNE